MTACAITGKISYATSALAGRARAALVIKPGFMRDPLNVFHCQHCGGYHLGRSRKQGKRFARRIPAHEHASVLSKLQRYRNLTR